MALCLLEQYTLQAVSYLKAQIHTLVYSYHLVMIIYLTKLSTPFTNMTNDELHMLKSHTLLTALSLV